MQELVRKKHCRILCPECGAGSKETGRISQSIVKRICKNNHYFVYNYTVETIAQSRMTSYSRMSFFLGGREEE